MKARLITSVAASLVYLGVYAGVSYWQGDRVAASDLALGTLAFFAVFFTVRTWLDRMRGARGPRDARSE